MAVDGATKEKKKKKKIKVEEDAGNTNVVQCHDVSVQTVVKKEPLEVNNRDEEEKKKKKKKKKKVKEEVEAIPVTVCYDASVQTTVKAELSETKISDAPEKTIKKKKRKMKEEPEPLLEIISEDGECLVSKKKKAKKKRCTDQVEGMKNKKMKKKVEVKEEEEEEEVDSGHGVETVEKKKKKKRKNEQELNAELEDGETKKKRKKKGADECKEEKVKKKKKKPSADDISSNEKPEKKSKKQKKNFKAVDEGESHPQANGGHVSSPDKRTKRKEKADDVSEKVEAEPAGKKGGEEDGNKALEEVKKQRASRAAIVFLSAKPGNQDEVSIDQERRLALQRDVDKESQPKPNLGQWGTVRFDSSDRQEKFLRLMGGFKKSSQPVAGSSGSANMALGKEGQQTLQQGLLGEFERAQSRHMDFRIKGAGLGFTAPSNKKFTIDTNARNSIRFDD